MRFTRSIVFRLLAAIALLLVALQVLQITLVTWDKRQAGRQAAVEDARHVLMMTEAVREDMERRWDSGTYSPEKLARLDWDDPAERERIKNTIPIIVSWRTAQTKAEEGGYRFRPVREGARNPEHEADAVEREALDFFRANPGAEEHHVVDREAERLRYFRPVRLSESCLVCHGDPARSQALWGNDDGLDITGNRMDGMESGDLIGTFEIIKDLGPVEQRLAAEATRDYALGLVGLLAVLGLAAWIMHRLLGRPLHRAVGQLSTAAESRDLTVRLSNGQDTEIGTLAHAFNHYAADVGDSLVQVNDRFGELPAIGSRLESATERVREGAERQYADVDSLTAAMEQMTTAVEEIARATAEASGAADGAERSVAHGETAVSENERAIRTTAEEIDHADRVIASLSASSVQIGEVLDLIESIAEQTNLLSLNAAIEAARAGDAGRGFSVVAEEVRTLANRTRQSTEDIRSRIDQLRGETDEAVTAMQRGRSATEESVARARGVTEALDDIRGAVDTIARMNTQVATAAEQQSASSAEIRRNVEGIRDVAGEATENAENTAGIGRELRRLTGDIQATLAVFRLPRDAARADDRDDD